MASNRFKIIVEATPDVAKELEHLFLSKNDKTGWSINTSIAMTCQPTRACQQYCYGLTGRIAMPGALNRQAENATFFSVEDWAQLADEAVDLTHVVSRQQGFLRIFGVGDLQPGSVYFINQMATYASGAKPAFQIWLSTRKFELASRLVVSPNLHVMMSFDHTTPPKAKARGLALLMERRPQWFAAWVRLSEDEVIPDWVSVVFEEHRLGRGRANRVPERRACPATVHEDHGGVSHDGACAKCRYCFDVDKRALGSPLAQLRRKR